MASERKRNQIGKRTGREFTDFAGESERAGAVDGRHPQNSFRRHRRVVIRQRTHLGEQIQFRIAPADYAGGCEAVGAQAQIHAGASEARALKRRVLKIVVTARAMNDMGFVFREQSGIAAREAIDVDGKDIFAEQPLAREVGDGRAETAVGIVAVIAAKPPVHFAARVAEHFKFLHRLRDVDADGPTALARERGSEPEQFR